MAVVAGNLVAVLKVGPVELMEILLLVHVFHMVLQVQVLMGMEL